MSQVFVTSDLHLGGHVKVARHRYPDWEDRPDAVTTGAHDYEVLEALYKLPRYSHLMILGDLSGRTDHEDAALNMLSQVAVDRALEMYLVPGNHDSCHPLHGSALTSQAKFGFVFKFNQIVAKRRWGKGVSTEYLFSHFPYDGDTEGREGGDRFTQYRLQDEGLPVVHGHTHGKYKTSRSKRDTLQVHVGFDAWRRPVALEEIVAIIKAERP